MSNRKLLAVGGAAALAVLFMAGGAFAQDAEQFIPEEAKINVKNILAWGSWVGVIIILHSIAAVALMIEHAINIKRDKLVPPEIIDEIEALFEEEEYQEALELCEASPNFVTNILAAGLPKLNNGFDTMKQIMSEQAAVEATKLHQKISYLSLISNLAPMWGLFGTVSGMILAFANIVILGPKVTPKDLAMGVQQALITTFEGLFVAMPCMMAFFWYRNKVVALINELTGVADEMVERFRPQRQ
ncbi:MAG: MotA/TolQ/ExbB proton channel family protein [Planctomycetaceae bacterium]|nr:MotA/TolQ/ExbB proton channel family protein [Planctomycetota bacterium]NUN52399.1 MotA/TolQ/ExbB proton channel family protein [Planctomycetaceae bacterium]